MLFQEIDNSSKWNNVRREHALESPEATECSVTVSLLKPTAMWKKCKMIKLFCRSVCFHSTLW